MPPFDAWNENVEKLLICAEQKKKFKVQTKKMKIVKKLTN
jgi:hypothetical protein